MLAQHERIQSVFQSLWSDFVSFNPSAKRIYDLLLEREARYSTALVNDHVALRTFSHPRLNIEILSKPFLELGYRPGREYQFEQKKLFARHYEPPKAGLPKVFLSELQISKCSKQVQSVAEQFAEAVTETEVSKAEFLWSGRPFAASHSVYQTLLAESEYAAWVYAFGYRANHFTVSFNDLRSFESLSDLGVFLRANGYALNMSGGEIKGSPAELLEQSSTLAEPRPVNFTEGVFEIPACYYEFARRYPDQSGQLYQGFIAQSADKIFESTNAKRRA